MFTVLFFRSRAMSEIFREVDEDLRRDRAIEVWKKYGPVFLGIAIAIVAATGGYRYYRHVEAAKAEAFGARFQTTLLASEAGRNADAAKEFALIAGESPAGYALLANFRAAADLAATDKAAGAAKFDALAENNAAGPVLQGLARLRAATLLADDLTLEDLQKRVEPLLAPSSPWAANARELIGLRQLASGAVEEAGKTFDAIMTDTAAPAALKQRSEVYLALVKGGGIAH